MSTDSSIPVHAARHSLSLNDDDPFEDDSLARPARFGKISELTAVRGIIDVTMVGLMGGGPRLAIRAARVLLEDSYASRSEARQGSTQAGTHFHDA
jgi:hypothetical protein